MTAIRVAFREGFNYGEANGEATASQAEHSMVKAGYMRITDDMVRAFCCGSEDGEAGDRWRLDLDRPSWK